MKVYKHACQYTYMQMHDVSILQFPNTCMNVSMHECIHMLACEYVKQ